MPPFYTLICFVLMMAGAECSKILIIIGISARSHHNVFAPIIEELANRKHDVTVQAYFEFKPSRSNVKELIITQGKYDLDPEEVKAYFLKTLTMEPIPQIANMVNFLKPNCASYLNDPTTKALISAGMQYDLVLIDTFCADCQTAVASLVGKHIVNMYTCAHFPWKAIPAPTPPSYVPNSLAFMPSKMNFFQRFQNAINFLGTRYVYQRNLQVYNDDILSKMLPQAGTIEEIERKVTFSITNGDPVVDVPRPTMPNIVHCGGMHCRKARPLPKDLNDFVESSGDDGFVIFGLGSNMKSEYLTPEALKDIVSALSRLKQKVVWKFGAKLENLPKNIKLVDWMPQQDLLGHPKARLFITHSGLLSLQEAIYHAVPIIGMPFFGDQRGNIIRMKELGLAEHYDFLNITVDGFYHMITQVLNDRSYYDNMKKYSSIFKDQPERPIVRAMFWIEYVIRHDGARHFRSPGEDLNFFQYFLLDVVGFMLLVGSISAFVLVYLVRAVLRKLFCKKQSGKDHEKKRK